MLQSDCWVLDSAIGNSTFRKCTLYMRSRLDEGTQARSSSDFAQFTLRGGSYRSTQRTDLDPNMWPGEKETP